MKKQRALRKILDLSRKMEKGPAADETSGGTVELSVPSPFGDAASLVAAEKCIFV